MKCRICNKTISKPITNLGKIPLANSLSKTSIQSELAKRYDLNIFLCSKCNFLQLDHKVLSKKIFDNDYSYFSSFSNFFLSHAKKSVSNFIKTFNLDNKSFVIEIGSNDGYLLQFLKEKKIPCIGIEPTKSTAMMAQKKGIKTIRKFFNINLAKYIINNFGTPDLVIVNNVLAHNPNPVNFLKGIEFLIKEKGVCSIEFPDSKNLINKKQFDTIYHEHYSYFSNDSFLSLVNKSKLVVIDFKKIKTHGGSLRVILGHQNNFSKNKSFYSQPKKPKTFYKKLPNLVNEYERNFFKFLNFTQKKGETVIGYGAAAKCSTILNIFNINASDILYIIDKNPYKVNKFISGTNIEIKDIKFIKKIKPDFVIIFPWNITDEIIKELNYIKEWNGKFVVFTPNFKVINP